MGYLQVSITVVGPGEHKPKHDRVAEKKEEQAKADARAAKRGSRSTMHIPPHVLTKSGMKATEYLTLRFYEATNLPTLNKDSGRYVKRLLLYLGSKAAAKSPGYFRFRCPPLSATHCLPYHSVTLRLLLSSPTILNHRPQPLASF